MRDSVPSGSYSSVCNVLRQWNILLIPTYRVYRLYDRVYRLYDNTLKLPLSGRLLSGHVCLPGATLRVANKAKRLQFAQDFLHEAATGFNDVVFTDETSIQLESHRRFCCRKRRQPPKTKPRYIYTRIGILLFTKHNNYVLTKESLYIHVQLYSS